MGTSEATDSDPLQTCRADLEDSMDDQKRARLATLLHRQTRAGRTPEMLEAWRNLGVRATALSHERSEQVIGWLRANWREPDQLVVDLERHLAPATESLDAIAVLDFWRWDEAVAVLVPASSLLGTARRLQEIYQDGFLAVDQLISTGLLVDFDEHVVGARIALVGSGADD